MEQGHGEAIDHQLMLAYTPATCDKCGTTVAAAEACPCGSWQGALDPLVERRRAALAGLLEVLSEPVEDEHTVELQDALDLLSPWITEFFARLNTLLSTEEGASEPLRAHLEELSRLRARMSAARPLRPWIALWRPLHQTANQISAMAERFLAAALAPTRDAARRDEQSAQAALDEAARSVLLVSERLSRWGMTWTVRLPDSAVQSARRAYEMTGAVDVLDLDARGGRAFARITGRAATTQGIGAALTLETAHVADAADEDRFWEGAAAAYRVLSASPDAFRQVMADTAWSEALATCRRDLYDVLVLTEVLLRGLRPGEQRMEIDAVLRLGARLTESVGRRLLGLLLSLSSPSRATKLLKSDSGDIVKQARQGNLSGLTFGFDAAIRNADAHREYRVEADGVAFTSRTREYDCLSLDELADRVLGALESAVMITVVLDCAMVEGGFRLPDLPSDMPLDDRVTILMAIGGVTDAMVTQKGETLVLRGRAAGEVPPTPLILIAFLEPHLPPDVTTVRLAIEGRQGGRLTARGPLSPFRREPAEGAGRDAAVVETLAKWKVNGRPVASQAWVRRWAAICAAQLADADLDVAEPRLHAMAAAATRIGDRELREALDAFLAIKRARTTGASAPAIARQRNLRLVGWLQSPAQDLNDGSNRSTTLPPGLTPA
jgi:hypothetical protein